MSRTPRCTFVPPYLVERAGLADRQLALDRSLRVGRAGPASPPPVLAVTDAAWTVHTAAGSSRLPGDVVRRAGDPDAGDPAVDEAALGISGALALFEEVYGRSSYDGAGAPVSLTVHYQRDYANAFWDGTQLVFGDGDGEIFDRFTKPVDVLGHELAHAVTERSAGLVYQGQPGALNESLSDVFASCLKQRLLGQLAADGDWLIGAGLFLPGVQARALRDMAAPGTAYDDPRLGKDPQPAHLDDYVEGPDDNGGVHLNSGIPNRAFHLAAVGIGGSSCEGAGRVWYDALVSDRVGPDTDFAGFAAATIALAGPHVEAVSPSLGDGRRGRPHPAGAAPPAPATQQLRVRRTGRLRRAGRRRDPRRRRRPGARRTGRPRRPGRRRAAPCRAPTCSSTTSTWAAGRPGSPSSTSRPTLRTIVDRVLRGPDVVDSPRE